MLSIPGWPESTTCEHCKHWMGEIGHDEEGECALMANEGYREPSYPRTGARAEGSNSCRGHGYTRYWFGCNQFEPITPPAIDS